MSERTWSNDTARELLERMFAAAVSAADPSQTMPGYLPAPPAGRTIVVGAGKAGARMAAAVEAHWQGPLEGIVIVPHGYASECEKIEVVEGGHPVPDEAGADAARRILALAETAGPDDLVLCLISGGGSALMSLPASGLMMHEKAALTGALLKSGADIAEMNCVRKHLSAIKGGRLAAAAAPARLVTLLVSDVPGDDLSVIASGPTVPDPTTVREAADILRKYDIKEPVAAVNYLKKTRDETLKPGDPCFEGNEVHLVATPQKALEAAAAVAEEAGIGALILGDAIEGEAREVARVMAAIARQVRSHAQPAPPPLVLLSGGETTVTVRGDGRGGRNAEFMLALAVALAEEAGVYALAADTDGIDGTEDNAGAFVAPDTLARAVKSRSNPKKYLGNNDAYRFFRRLDDLFVTGPTQTNVNDFRAILVV